MLEITIPSMELYDEVNEEFITIDEKTLQLEHSLISISKWESKWHKAFLAKGDKTTEEIIDYIRCMTLNKGIDDRLYNYLSPDNVNQVVSYIEEPMTATWFSEDNSGEKNHEVVTSELIYYWMIELHIPVDFQRWHLNRLLTLIRVCTIKNTPPKKMSKRDIMNRNSALNKARRAAMNSKG